MRARSEQDALPAVRQWTVQHPVSGGVHRFEDEDHAVAFAADLAIVHAYHGRPVQIAYPNGMTVELSARVVGKRPRPGLPTEAEG